MKGLVILYAVFTVPLALAQQGPANLNISGGLFQPDGKPILSNSVNFKLEVYDKTGACLLYSESHPAQDLSASKGGFALELGKGAGINNAIDLSNPTVMTSKVFENSGVVAGGWTGCASGTTLVAGDNRVIRVTYDIAGGTPVVMNPDVPIGAAAYSIVAETLQGLRPADFLQVRDDVPTDLSQANLENIFSASNYTKLNALVSGSSSQYMVTNPAAAVDFNSQRITGVAAPSAATDASNKGYVDGNIGGKTADVSAVGPAAGDGYTLIWDQAAQKWTTGVPSAIDNSKLPLVGGTMTGDITMGGNNLLGTGHITMSPLKTLTFGTLDTAQEAALVATLLPANAGASWYNSQTKIFKIWDGTSAIAQVYSVNGKTGGAITLNANDLGLGTAALENVGTAAGEIPVLDGTGKVPMALLPTFNWGDIANTAGVYMNYAPNNVACADGKVLKWDLTNTRWICGDDLDSFSGSAAGGDLTGTYPNPTIAANAVVTAKINDAAVTTPKLFANPGINRLVATDGSSGAALVPFECTGLQIMQWSGTGWSCQTVSSALGTGYIVDGGNARGTALSIGTNDTFALNLRTNGVDRLSIDTSGNVGITGGLGVNGALNMNGQNITGVGSNLTATGALQVGSTGANSLTLASTNTTASAINLAVSGVNGGITLAPNGTGVVTASRPMVITPSTVPASTAGTIFFDSAASNAMKYYDGSAWISIGAGTGDFLRNGSLSMTGALDMGSQNITNVGTNVTGSAALTVRSAAGSATTLGNNGAASTTSVTSGTGGTSIDSSGDSLLTSSKVAAGATTVSSTGGTTATTLITSNGTSASSVNITSTGANGGITLAPNGTGVVTASRPMVITPSTVPTSTAGTIFFDSAASNAMKYFDGTAWVSIGAGTGDFLKNGSIAMTGALQMGTQNITDVGTNITATGALQVGSTGANSLTLASTNTTASAINLAVSGVNGGITLAPNGTGVVTASRPMVITPSTVPASTAGTIFFDSAASNAMKYFDGTAWVSIGAGTGDFLKNGSLAMTGNFDAGTNNLNNVGAINGSGALPVSQLAGSAMTLGNSGGASSVTVQSGTGDATVSGAGTSTLTSSKVAAGATVVSSTGGTTATTLITSNGTSAAAVNITSTGANSGITLAPNGTGVVTSARPLTITPSTVPASTAGTIFFDSAASNAMKYFDGTAWVSIGAGTGDFLKNGSLAMTGALQMGTQNITGVGTNITATGALQVGSTGANSLTLASTNTTASAINLAVSGVNGGITLAPNGTGVVTASRPMVITPSTVPASTAGTIFFDSAASNAMKYFDGTAWVSIGSGTGDFLKNGTIAMTGNFDAGTNNVNNVGAINGSGALAVSQLSGSAMTVGNAGGASSVTLQSGTGDATVSGAGTSTLSSSKVAAGATVVSSTGGTTATTLITSNGTSAAAVNITSTGANSGITLAPNGTGVVTSARPMVITPSTVPTSTAGTIFFDSAASNAMKYFDGSAWIALGAGTGDFLKNGSIAMTGALQMGTQNITGVGTNITGTGALQVGSTGANSLTLASTNTTGSAINLAVSGVNGGITLAPNGTGVITASRPMVITPSTVPASTAGTIFFDSAASNAMKYFDGTAWIALGAGTGDFLKNGSIAMTGALQMGTQNITGVGTNITGTGALQVGSTGANSLTLASTNTTASAINLAVSGVNGGITLTPNGTGVVTSARPMTITPSTVPASAAGTIFFDSAASNAMKYYDGSAWISVGAGTGDFLKNGTIAMTGNFDAGTNNVNNVGAINGSGALAVSQLSGSAMTLGNAGGASSVAVQSGTGDATVSGAGTSTLSSSKVAAGATVVSSTGGTSATTLITSNGTSAAAVNITSTGANSGITLAPNGTGVVTSARPMVITPSTVPASTAGTIFFDSAASNAMKYFDGTAWVALGAGTGDFLKNGSIAMTGALQMGTQNITGVGTNITGTGALQVGSTGANSLTLASTNTTASAINLAVSGVNGGITLAPNGTGVVTSARPMTITPSTVPASAAGTIFFDSAASNAMKYYDGSAWISVGAGTGDFLKNGSIAMTGALQMGTQNITGVGTNITGTGALQVGSTGANSLTLASTNTTASAINLAVSGVNGGITLTPNGTGVVTSARPMVITPSTVPTSTAGTIFFDSAASNAMKYYDGSAWVSVGSGTGDFLKNGSIAMTGALQMGTQNITGVGTNITGTGALQVGSTGANSLTLASTNTSASAINLAVSGVNGGITLAPNGTGVVTASRPLVITPSTVPASTAGTIFFDSAASNAMKYYDGSAWVALGAGTGDFLKNGSIAMTGNLNAGSNGLINVASVAQANGTALTLGNSAASSTASVIGPTVNIGGSNTTILNLGTPATGNLTTGVGSNSGTSNTTLYSGGNASISMSGVGDVAISQGAARTLILGTSSSTGGVTVQGAGQNVFTSSYVGPAAVTLASSGGTTSTTLVTSNGTGAASVNLTSTGTNGGITLAPNGTGVVTSSRPLVISPSTVPTSTTGTIFFDSAASNAMKYFDGSAWVSVGSGTGDFLKNGSIAMTGALQMGTQNITGVGTNITGTGALQVGSTGANSLTLASTNTTASAINLAVSGVNGGITLAPNGTGVVTASRPLVITPSTVPTSTAGTIYFDSGAGNAMKYYDGSAWVALGAGTGDFLKNGSVAMTGALQMGSQNITGVGTNITATAGLTVAQAAGSAMVVGSNSGASTMTINSGTGGLDVSGTGTTTVTSSKVAAGATTISATGGTTATTLITSNGTSAAAVNITSTGANSGITLAPNGTGVVTSARPMVITPSTVPGSTAGTIFFDSAASNAMKYYDGSAWVSVGAGTGDFLKNGSIAMTGALQMGTQNITGVGTNITATGALQVGSTGANSLTLASTNTTASAINLAVSGVNGGITLAPNGTGVVTASRPMVITPSTVPTSTAGTIFFDSAASNAMKYYDGSAWVSVGAGTGDFLKNGSVAMTGALQMGSQNITGVGTNITATAGLTVAQAAGSAMVVGSNSGASTMTINSGTGGLDVSGSGTTTVTSSKVAAGATTLSSTGGTTATTLITSNGTGADAVNITSTGANSGITLAPNGTGVVTSSRPMVITPTAASPNTAGALWFDSGSSNALKYYNGSAWVALGSGTGDFLKNGSVAMTGNFDAGTNNLNNIGAINGAAALAVSQSSGSALTLGNSGGASSATLQSGTGNATVSGAGVSTLTSSKVAAGATVVSSTGGTTATTLITSNGTSAAAVNITSTGANSGITLAPNGTGVVTSSRPMVITPSTVPGSTAGTIFFDSAASNAMKYYDGSAWVAVGSGTGDFLKNGSIAMTGALQMGTQNITGVGTNITGTGALQVGSTGANSLTLASTNTTASAINLAVSGVNGGITLAPNGTGVVTASRPLVITPSTVPASTAGTIFFDSAASNAMKYYDGSAWVALGAGTGDFLKNGSVAMTGALQMGSQNITGVGTNITATAGLTVAQAAGSAMVVGSNSGASTMTINSGTGGLDVSGTGTTTVTSSKVAAGATVVSATGGTTATTLITSNGTSAAAVNITSTGANSGITLAPNGTGVVTSSRPMVITPSTVPGSTAGTIFFDSAASNAMKYYDGSAWVSVGSGTGDFLKNGSVAMTGALQMGTQNITDVGTNITATGALQVGSTGANSLTLASTNTTASAINLAVSGVNGGITFAPNGTGVVTASRPLVITPSTVPASTAGTIFFDSAASNAMKYYDGSAWVSVGSGAGDFLKNGSIAMTGALQMGSQNITGVGTNITATAGLTLAQAAGSAMVVGSNSGASTMTVTSGTGGLSVSGTGTTTVTSSKVAAAATTVSSTGGTTATTLITSNGTGADAVNITSTGVNSGITLAPNGTGVVTSSRPLVVTPTAASPNTAGALWFDSASSNALKFYDGSAWQTVGTGSGSGDFLKNGSVAMTGDFNAGGNRVLGNSTASANLELESTSNVTKGYVLLQKNGGNVGIGTATPGSALQIGSGQILTPDGSAALPSYTFTSQSSTGIYFPVAGQIGFSTAGTNRATIGSAGFFGNGAGAFFIQPTSSAAAPTYSWITDGGTGIFRPTASTVAVSTGGSERLRVDSSGNVGIGSTTPRSAVDINHTPGVSAGLRIGPAIEANTTSWQNRGYLSFNSLLTTSIPMMNGFTPIDKSGSGMIMTQAGNASGDLDFYGINWAASSAERNFPSAFTHVLRIGSGGNIGIGTTNPGAKLHINGGNQYIQDPSNSVVQGLYFTPSDSSLRNYVQGYQTSTPSSDYLQIGSYFGAIQIVTGNPASSPTPRLTILNGGNVGIGTNNPARLLHVNGPMRITPTALPGTPAAGELAFDSGASNALKFYDGAAWQTVGTGTGSGDFLKNGTIAMTGALQMGSQDITGVGTNITATAGLTVAQAAGSAMAVGSSSGASTMTVNSGTGGLNVTGTGTTIVTSSKVAAGATTISSTGGTTATTLITSNGTGADAVNLTSTGVNSGITLAPNGTGVVTSSRPLVVTPTAASPNTAGALWFDSGSSNALKFYNGSAWQTVGTGSGDFLKNGSIAMTGALQMGTQNITGIGTNITATGALQVGSTGANSLTLASTNTTASAINLAVSGVNGGITLAPNGTGVVTASRPMVITPSTVPTSTAGTIFFDSAASNAMKYYDGSAWVSVGTGTGDFLKNGSVAMTGALQMGTQNITGVGTNITGTGALQVGSTGANSLTLASTNTTASAINLAVSGVNGGITLAPNGTGVVTASRPMVITPSTVPASTAGTIFFDSASSNAMKYYNGSAWVSVGSGSGDFMKNGSVAMTGALDMGTQSITNVGTNITANAGLTVAQAAGSAMIVGTNTGASTMTVTSGTGGLSVTGTGTTTVTSSKVAAAATTISATGGTTATTLITSNGTSASAVNITSTGTNSGITIAPNGTGVVTVSGALTTSGNVTAPAYFYTSDRRLKENIETVDADLITKLRGVTFNWKKDGKPEVGLIAQEVEEVVPELVQTNPETGLKSVKYGNIVALAIESIKALWNKVNGHDAEIERLAKENAALKQQMTEMQKTQELINQRLEKLERQPASK